MFHTTSRRTLTSLTRQIPKSAFLSTKLNNTACGPFNHNTSDFASLHLMTRCYSTTTAEKMKAAADSFEKHPQESSSKITTNYEEILKKLPVAFRNLDLELKTEQFTHAQKRLEQIRVGLYEDASAGQQIDESSRTTSTELHVGNTGKKVDASILAYQIALTAKQEDSQGNKRLYSTLMLERIEKDSVEKVKDNRDCVDFILQLISVFENVEEYDYAIRLYKWLIDHHQQYNVIYYCRIGELYEKKQHFSMAQQYYQKCVEVNKNFGQGYHRLSNIYELKGQIAPALEYFAKYASLVFEREDEVQEDEYIHVGCKLGHLLSMNHNFDVADDYFQRLFSKYPNRIDVLYEWIVSLKRQRMEGRDTRPALKLAAQAVEQTIISSDSFTMEMYRSLCRLHLALETHLVEQIQKEKEQNENEEKQEKSAEINTTPLSIEESWKFIEEAWKNARNRHDQQLVIWEAINLTPEEEAYHDKILGFLASHPELYTNNAPFWRRFERLTNTEAHELTEENEYLKKKSFDVELYLVDNPVALVTILADSMEDATNMALRFGKHVHPEASITNVQHPSLFYKPETKQEYDLYGIKDIHTSTA